MGIKFSGEFATDRSAEAVFDFLSDPSKFGPLLPEFQSMTVLDATHFVVKVGVGVSHIRGTAEIRMELSEADRPRRAQYKGHGSAVGSQVTVIAGFDLSPAAAGSKVNWQGEANIFGKLASMAGGMLEPLARKNLQALVNGLQSALNGAAMGITPAEVEPESASITSVDGTTPATASTAGVEESAQSDGANGVAARQEESSGASQSAPYQLQQNIQPDSEDTSGTADHGSADEPSS